MIYYDTGVLLKLYTNEEGSGAVQRFVVSRGDPIPVCELHLTEATNALRLKAHRSECSLEETTAAIADMEDDLRHGVLRKQVIEWEDAWRVTRALADSHSSRLGCRTLDILHIACARQLGLRDIATTDSRQAALAEACGLAVHKPA